MTALFNGPVEIGVRSLILVLASHPRALDINELVILDYFLVHSGDLADGPPSIHPPSPLRTGEVAIRRGLVEEALLLLKSRGLVREDYSPHGIRYAVGEYGPTFVDALSSPHASALRAIASWLVARLGDASADTLLDEFTGSLGKWRQEFVTLASVDAEAV